MYGLPDDVENECNAHLYLSDDAGDNSCTIRCQLKPGHELPHKEEFKRGDKPVIVTWYVDEQEDEVEIGE